MRKLFYFLVVMSLSLTLLGNSQAAMGGVMLKELPSQSPLKSMLNLNTSTTIENIIVLPEGTFDEHEAASIISRIDSLPASLLDKVNRKGIKVHLFDGKLTDNPTARHLKGVIPRGYLSKKTWDEVPGIGGSKTVLVKIGHSNKGMGHGSVNLELHELAHSIDRYVYNEIRNNKRFLKIWNAEKYNMFPNQSYFLSFSEEYFAEAFAMYHLGGDYRNNLLQKAPLTYEFIRQLK